MYLDLNHLKKTQKFKIVALMTVDENKAEYLYLGEDISHRELMEIMVREFNKVNNVTFETIRWK